MQRLSIPHWWWLNYIGYSGDRTIFGPLSKRKKNWSSKRIAAHLGYKHPKEFTVFKTEVRLGAFQKRMGYALSLETHVLWAKQGELI